MTRRPISKPNYPDFQSIIASETFQTLHQDFLSKQSRFALYRVRSLNIITIPGVYHPEPGSSSLALVDAVLRSSQQLHSPMDRMLDLGCGTGAVGLCLQQYATKLYLSDINPRAVFCARFNAWINRISAQVYLSNLFQSFQGLTFNLVLFNVPFLQKPIDRDVELATNDPGGQIFLRFLQQVPNYLTPEGEVFFTYSNLANLDLLDQIPSGFTLDQVVFNDYPEMGVTRYVFRLARRSLRVA